MADNNGRDYFTSGQGKTAADCMADGYSSPSECAEGRGDPLAPTKPDEPITSSSSITVQRLKPTDNFNVLAPSHLENREFSWEFADLVNNGEFEDMDPAEKLRTIEKMDYIINVTGDHRYYTVDERELNGFETAKNDFFNTIEEKTGINMGAPEISYKEVFKRGDEVESAYNKVEDNLKDYGLGERDPTLSDYNDAAMGTTVFTIPGSSG